MVDARSEVFHRAFAKLVDPEDKVVYIRDPINVVLKDIYAEWMAQTWGGKKRQNKYGQCVNVTLLIFHLENELNRF